MTGGLLWLIYAVKWKEEKPLSHAFDVSVKHLRKALMAVLPNRQPSGQRARVVLIVDDEPLIVQGLAAILGQEGFTVLTAFDAEAALKLVQQASPELLISDVHMPGMDGIELAVRLVTALPSLKVLLFSADFANLKINFNAGASEHFSLLSKPVLPQQMLERVRATLTDVVPTRETKSTDPRTDNSNFIVGSRPRTNRSNALPLPASELPTLAVPAEDINALSVAERLNARRRFLKIKEGRAPAPVY